MVKALKTQLVVGNNGGHCAVNSQFLDTATSASQFLVSIPEARPLGDDCNE
jgi:hypothetical protein